jgi:FAD/FMN-containing dehydrogenase
MNIKHDLGNIVGYDNVSDDSELLRKYSKDHSFVKGSKPSCIVYAENSQHVQGIVRYANDYKIPVTPRSSGVAFYGASLPDQGGIVIDLTRMNKVLKIDPGNKFVKIEPGVTWGQIQPELEKQGLMICNPLFPHPLKSVLTSSVEGEPILIPKGEYSETCLTAEIVLPNGEMYWSGSAMGKGFASGNFPDCVYPSARFFLGMEGTLGIMTWANIKAEWLPTKEKILFMSFERIEDLAEPVYQIQRRMIGRECFVLNRFALATILAKEWPQDFKKLMDDLAPWILIVSLAGLRWFPEEKIRYEEEALMEIASRCAMKVLPTVADLSGLGVILAGLLKKAWSEAPYWKFRYKGACHEVFFHTTLEQVAAFTKAVYEVSGRHGYSTSEISFYLQPIEYGRACFCQYGFHCNPNDAKDVERIRGLYLEVSEVAIDMGGLFVTPYGPWADMVYRRCSTLSSVMKRVKDALDPNHILNPGKLSL